MTGHVDGPAVAVVCPGQGAQSPGMLASWTDLPGVTDRLAHFGAVVGRDLLALGTTGSAEEITDTAVTQPLLAAAALVTAEQLGLLEDAAPGSRGASGARDAVRLVIAGHSIGELPAAAVAGALTPDDALAFAGRRGAAMAAACDVAPSTMAAVLGGDADAVVAAIEAAGAVPANRNGAGQVVAAGSTSAIEALVADPPAGARVRPLTVAGAFHSAFMEPAEAELAAWVRSDPPRVADPSRTFVSNADGAAVTDGEDLLHRLIGQVTRPVRWDLVMDTMTAMGVTTVVELAPGGTLTGLAKRAMKGVRLVPVRTPDDLDAARAALSGTEAAP